MAELDKFEDMYDSIIEELKIEHGKNWITNVNADEKHFFITFISDIIDFLLYKNIEKEYSLFIDEVNTLLHFSVIDINKKFYEFSTNYKAESKNIFMDKLEEVIENKQIVINKLDKIKLLTEILRRILSDEAYVSQLMKFIYSTNILKEEK